MSAMEPRVSLITLAVADVPLSAAFYEALGWHRVPGDEGIVAFDLLGQALGLYPKASLAQDLGIAEADIGGFSGVTFSHNVRHKEEVAPILAAAEAAGGKILRPAHDIFWGGYIGYFSDLDGHVWEVSHNPFSALSKEGAFRWNGY